MGEEQLHQLIRGCMRQERASQKMLYKTFYGFSMGICLRYANNRDDAAEIMNQGFYKVFTRIETYDISKPFMAWLGRIMMNTSIDHYRSNIKSLLHDDLETAEHISDGDFADKKLAYEELLAMVQRLPTAYRTVFNLFAIEGYTHEEIGEMLGISAGTSKSNLHKARHKLRQMIAQEDMPDQRNNYNKDINYSPIAAISKVEKPGVIFNKNIRE